MTAAARQPLTVEDIPAGQGPASLFAGPGPVRFESAPDTTEIMWHGPDSIEVIDLPDTPGGAAIREMLAATLPTVAETTEEDQP